MKTSNLYLNGGKLQLGNRIGKGGEGEVYLVGGDSSRAVKLYTGSNDDGREAKVREMVRLGLARSSSLISFPEEVVTDKSGRFVGFTMRLVQGHKPLHELYGVKSRKIHFPKADFRFLIRSAANTARAVGQVHDSPCVIGDINHSGILVSSDARVALIDADSFQLQSSGRVFPCLVGVPDFTPPELQGASLRGVTRTKTHDLFGLAVAIFQLLFMGRHPYAGRQTNGDFTLDQLIARGIFAYSKARKQGVVPPVGVITLDNFPAEIADAFERAFGTDPSRRPNAVEWANHLQDLEKHLNRCSANSMHFYPSICRSCSWCEMEGVSGAILFAIGVSQSATPIPSTGTFDVEKIWAAIRSISLPPMESALPKMPTLPTIPSPEALLARDKFKWAKAIPAAAAAVVVFLWFSFPAFTIFWLIALGIIWSMLNKEGSQGAEWKQKYSEVDLRWAKGLDAWRNNFRLNAARELKNDLERAIDDYRGLAPGKKRAIELLKAERRNRQLSEYLDNYLVRDASIPGIGPARKVTLASFGVESAADVSYGSVTAISGFGDAMAKRLMDWRSSLERKFVYNPSPQPSDIVAQNRLESEFAARAVELAKKISGGHVELAQIATAFLQAQAVENPHLSKIAVARAQLRVDLEYLGITIPPQQSWSSRPSQTWGTTSSSSSSTSVASFPYSGTTSGTSSASSLDCPRCGSPMVRRMARKGFRRGNYFWGCSTYPRCKGTRN